MSGNQVITVGDRGRLVLPMEIRERRGITTGTDLVAIDSDEGILLVTIDQLEQRVRAAWAGSGASPVDELIAERRAASAIEDAES